MKPPVSDLPQDTRTAAELLSGMMRKELFLISNRSLVDPRALQSELRAHLLYIIGLEQAGVLFASGPVLDESGEMTGDGVTIVRAASFEEARLIAKDDPFVAAGLREPSIHRWVVNEGRITVSVDLSNRGGALP
ncbi:YciI family protein [Mesorhizobium sp.]|uniref:YciI family protein n=1 Tax=Mesorhizobium sp. TaxID=1871066 RepID=UPI0025C616AA|nr:YciI family protein [Mesorhizobium sp.]